MPSLPRRATVFAIISLLLAGCAGPPLTMTEEELAQPPTLLVGDPAPPLAVGTWVRSAPIERFAPGRVYVLDFWASWCQPCIESMSHTTDLERTQPEAIIIAITTEDDDNSLSDVRATVQSAPTDFPSRVAFDDGTTMAKAYRRGTHETGLPHAFIINQDGLLAWVGHPTKMDEPLQHVLARTWDIAAARRAHEAHAANERETTLAMKQLDEAKTNQEQLVALDRLCAVPPEDNRMARGYGWATQRVDVLVALQRYDEARAECDRTARQYADEPGCAVVLARAMINVDPARADELILQAQRAYLAEVEAAKVPAKSRWERWIRPNGYQWNYDCEQIATLLEQRGRYDEALIYAKEAWRYADVMAYDDGKKRARAVIDRCEQKLATSKKVG